MTYSVDELFSAVPSLFKQFRDNASVLPEGFQAVVLDAGDGTVVKFLKRKPEGGAADDIKRQFSAEIYSLMQFHGRAGEYFVPQLVEEPTFLMEDQPLGHDFMGYVRMTKVDGSPLEQRATGADSSQIVQLGEAIAVMHGLGDRFVQRQKSPSSRGQNFSVDFIRDDKLMGKVLECNDWLSHQDIAGYMHGDVNWNNVLFDKKGHLLSVIDFAFSGDSRNRFLDFANVSSDKVHFAVSAYNRASAAPALDPRVVEITSLRNYSDYVSFVTRCSQAAVDPKRPQALFAEGIMRIDLD